MTMYYTTQVKCGVRRTYIHCELYAVPGVHHTVNSDAGQMELLVDSRLSLSLWLCRCCFQLAAMLRTVLTTNMHNNLFISDLLQSTQLSTLHGMVK